MTDPQPGDFAVVSVGGEGGKLIGLGEKLCGDAFSQYQHAFVYVGGPVSKMIVEAEPGGARSRSLAAFETPGQLTLWSTGKISLTGDDRKDICARARFYVGTPYSWLDYDAIAAHRFHLPVPGLRGYIATTRHMICSQLVDQCYADAGCTCSTTAAGPGMSPRPTWPR